MSRWRPEILRHLTAVVVLALAGVGSLQGQVGVSSGMIQVSLIVRAAPRISLPAVSQPREAGREGNLRAATVRIRFSTSGAYRLVVRSTESRSAQRLWVLTPDGAFQELGAGSAVTVARGTGPAGEREREISYRIEPAQGETRLQLPVRYDILVEPTL